MIEWVKNSTVWSFSPGGGGEEGGALSKTPIQTSAICRFKQTYPLDLLFKQEPLPMRRKKTQSWIPSAWQPPHSASPCVFCAWSQKGFFFLPSFKLKGLPSLFCPSERGPRRVMGAVMNCMTKLSLTFPVNALPDGIKISGRGSPCPFTLTGIYWDAQALMCRFLGTESRYSHTN